MILTVLTSDGFLNSKPNLYLHTFISGSLTPVSKICFPNSNVTVMLSTNIKMAARILDVSGDALTRITSAHITKKVNIR